MSGFEVLRQRSDELIRNVERVIHGKTEQVELAVICLLAEGHLLIEDVPGVAKTSLARAIAQSIGGSVKRIQFTPDLLPSDVVGVRVFDEVKKDFEFRPGPVFANIVVADEINRASPKTQSALLEVMGEHRVTVGGETEFPPSPHFLIATQNPLEYQGTYPLPEAQLDRFLMRIKMDYPSFEHELQVVEDAVHRRVPETLGSVLETNTVLEMIETARQVRFTNAALEYIVSITTATRGSSVSDRLRLGASPRASNALALASQARAGRRGRSYVTADDIRAVARHVLEHRLLPSPEAEFAAQTEPPEDRDRTIAGRVLDEILDRLPVPPDAVGA